VVVMLLRDLLSEQWAGDCGGAREGRQIFAGRDLLA
jgi:hypothetical protein